MLSVYALVSMLPFLIRTNEVPAADLGNITSPGPCLSGPCLHGVCVDGGPSSEYRCYCLDGYTGLQCQTDFDDCRFGQCRNGATCLDRVASVQCLCPEGYSGHFCHENVNECLSNPCLNGACCLDRVNGFECVCQPGYEGERCEIDLDYCNETRTNLSVCYNGGTCVDGAGLSFNCFCPTGFDGVLCEHDIDECLSSPCLNGGECVEKRGNYSCNCPAGWTGRRCEIELRSCANNHCQNGALCLMEIPNNITFLTDTIRFPKCFCIPDYHGERCDKRYNECDLLKPCLNGATCVDGVDSVKCICPMGYSGTLCEYEECPAGNNSCPVGFSSVYQSKPSYDFSGSTIMIDPPSETFSSYVDQFVPYTKSTAVFSSIPSQNIELSSIISLSNHSESFDSVSVYSLSSGLDVSASEPAELTISASFRITPTVTSNLADYGSSDVILDSQKESFPSLSSFSLGETVSPNDQIANQSSFFQLTSSFDVVPNVTSWDQGTIELSLLSTFDDTSFIPETSSLTSSTSLTAITSNELFSTRVEISATVVEASSTLVLNNSIIQSTTTPEPSLPNGCDDLSCDNGGTILQILDENQQATCKCLCPLYFIGPNCEKETTLVIPYFSGQSFLKHSWDEAHHHGEKNFFSLLLSLRTESLNSFLLYAESGVQQRDTGVSFVSLHIQDGRLSYTFSCGSRVISLSDKSGSIATGYFTAVSLTLMWIPIAGDTGHCEGLLRLNDSSPMIGKHQTTKPVIHFRDIFVGGFPVGFATPSLPITSLPGFVGCVKDFQVNNVERQIIADAVEGAAITECQSYGCAANPCLNGAVCTSILGGWVCRCKVGYYGVLCERATCTANPCLNGGTCVTEVGGFLCLCPYGKRGKTCEESLVITRPAYFGFIEGYSSYLLYNNPHNVQNFVELRIRFTLRQQESFPTLLVYAGQSDEANTMSDFLALGVDNGHVIFLFNLGTGVRQLRASHPLKKDQLVHETYFGRHRRYGWLKVNGFKKAIGLGEGQLTGLNVAPEIFVGGHSSFNFTFLPEEIRHWKGFKGCVFDEEIRTTPWAPFQSLVDINSARNIHQCDAEECDLADCDNGASCEDLGSTFTCHCQPGWTGPLCKARVTPCSVGSHNCSLDSRCVPLLDGYRCDCPLGNTGINCEKNITLSDPLFRGHGSFMSFPQRNVREELHLVLEIKANSTEGILFYASQHGHSQTGDFVSLHLKESFVELRYNLGTGTGRSLSIKSLDPIPFGEWTIIKAGRYGRKGYLEANGERVEGSSPKGMKDLDVRTPFYLGGVEDPSWLNREAIEAGGTVESFQGCVRIFEVNEHRYDLSKEGALDGLNVDDCDGTGCGYNVCQNNGTCQFNEQNYTCICPLDYAGTRCELPIQCSNHQCQNGATCRAESADSYRCECPPGWNGKQCQIEMKLSAPYFDGESYLVYKDEQYEQRDLKVNHLEFRFNTKEPSGIILWNGKAYVEGDDYLGVGLVNGHLKLVWNLGWRSQSDIITANGTLADGQWHSVIIERSSQILRLSVDDRMYKNTVQGDFHELNSGPFIYLGGFEVDNVSDQTGGHFRKAFKGCISKLGVGQGDARNLKVVGGANVRNCPSIQVKV